MQSELESLIGRRRALLLGGTIAAGLASMNIRQAAFAAQGATAAQPPPAPAIPATPSGASERPGGKLPVKQIEQILQSKGKLSDGVLAFSQDRKDLHVTGPGGIQFKPAWEANHEFEFQILAGGGAMLSGEVSLLSKETNPVIDQILKHGLIFQALHQHFWDLSPQLFHIHFRGTGAPLDLARAVAAIVGVTGTPLPQKSEAEAKTPLDKDRLEKILGGTAEVADDGVVIVSIPRKEKIVVGGAAWKADMGLTHTVAFQPSDSGKDTAVAPDFALIASEINPLCQFMRAQGFTIHCLYNQETAESPQLYFSHQLAVGDAYDLAGRIRQALDLTNTKFKK
jgi:hypothetical protein